MSEETETAVPQREEDDPEIVNRRLSYASGYNYAMAYAGVRHYVGPLGDWQSGVPNFWGNPEITRRAVMALGQANVNLALEYVGHLKSVLQEKDLLPRDGDGNEFLKDPRTQILMYLMAPPSVMARALFRTFGAENNRGFDFDANGQYIH